MTHTTQQPGLHAHSWNPDTDLMDRYRLDRSLGENRGWLAIASFQTFDEVSADVIARRNDGDFKAYRVFDQFADMSITIYPGDFDYTEPSK